MSGFISLKICISKPGRITWATTPQDYIDEPAVKPKPALRIAGTIGPTEAPLSRGKLEGHYWELLVGRGGSRSAQRGLLGRLEPRVGWSKGGYLEEIERPAPFVESTPRNVRCRPSAPRSSPKCRRTSHHRKSYQFNDGLCAPKLPLRREQHAGAAS